MISGRAVRKIYRITKLRTAKKQRERICACPSEAVWISRPRISGFVERKAVSS